MRWPTKSSSISELDPQYVQIDTPEGYPIGKSSNMGDPAPGCTARPGIDERFTFARDTDGVALLVLDRKFSRNGKTIVIAHIAQRLDIIDRETRRAQTILVLRRDRRLHRGRDHLALRGAQFSRSGRAAHCAMEEIGSEKLGRQFALETRR